ncbi:MAG: serine/threonine-protein kinase, partial [Gemmataceae bacterium]|nr:serine/threonine-protein kinase [Gemmataceae bacterium]
MSRSDDPTLPPVALGEQPTLAPAPSHDAPARLFAGHELLEEIARRGMGVVYKARHVALGRIVALKMILAGQLASAADVERFRLEARTAANLHHPGIVAIHEIGEQDGQAFFSMDFVDGPSLASLVRDKPLPPDQAARLTEAVARAVQFAHDHGVLHRDLKPGNVLLRVGQAFQPDAGGIRLESQTYHPVVTDFGLAKQTRADAGLTDTGAILGTPGYMPPEQASGQAVGPAADIYSLGAILYELLTGRPPFRAATAFDTLLQVLNDEPAPPRLLNRALSRDLETVVLKCLAKDPAKRYASAAALADDLAAIREGRPIQARRPGLGERLARYLWQHRRTVGTATAAVGLVAAVAFGSWAILSFQHRSTLGRREFVNEGQMQRAEVRREGEDALALPAFATPTLAPVALPQGRYRVALTGPRRVGEEYRFAVTAGTDLPLRLDLADRMPFDPLSLPSPVLVAPPWLLASERPWRLAAFDGEDGQRAWTLDLQLLGRPAVLGTTHDPALLHDVWQHALHTPSLVESRQGLVLAAGVQFDGLISLTAEGKLRWWHPPLPDLPPKRKTINVRGSTRFLGRPVRLGGRFFVLSGFTEWVTDAGSTARFAALDAIDAETGKRLWRHRLPHGWLRREGWFQRELPEAVGPFPVRLAGRDALLVHAGTNLLAVDAETGKAAGPAHPIGFGPTLFPPRVLGERYVAVENKGGIESLASVDIATGKVAWRWRIDGEVLADLRNRHMPPEQVGDWLHVSGDALLVRTVDGLACLDAATGEERWGAGRLPERFRDAGLARFVAGPDLDGDGVPDVFLA